MSAPFDRLKGQIEAAELRVYAADRHAARSQRALRSRWRAKAPMIVGGVGAVLLLYQLLRARRKVPRDRVRGQGLGAWLRAYGPYASALGPQALAAGSAVLAAMAAKNAKKALVSAAYVDLDRFVGSWFEIARLPEGQDSDRAADNRVTYARADNGLRLLTLSRRPNGGVRRSTGRAKLADEATQARFKVSYSHPLLDPVPFVWSDYTIIDVADDYASAIVGNADRKQLWLLARQTSVTDATRQDFLTKARAQGFDTSALIYTRHDGESVRAST